MQTKIKELKRTLEQDRSKGTKSGSKSDVTCYECGEKGHIKPDCPKLKSGGKSSGKSSGGSKSSNTKSNKGHKQTHGLSTEKAVKVNE